VPPAARQPRSSYTARATRWIESSSSLGRARCDVRPFKSAQRAPGCATVLAARSIACMTPAAHKGSLGVPDVRRFRSTRGSLRRARCRRFRSGQVEHDVRRFQVEPCLLPGEHDVRRFKSSRAFFRASTMFADSSRVGSGRARCSPIQVDLKRRTSSAHRGAAPAQIAVHDELNLGHPTAWHGSRSGQDTTDGRLPRTLARLGPTCASWPLHPPPARRDAVEPLASSSSNSEENGVARAAAPGASPGASGRRCGTDGVRCWTRDFRCT
jgi:hypothetical protein